jgi:imidazolonepropionase
MLQVARQLALNNPVDISPTLLAAHAVPRNTDRIRMPISRWSASRSCPRCGKRLFEAVDVFCENVGFHVANRAPLPGRVALGIPVKGHVEQLSNQGGAALVSRYKGLSADHIEYLDDAGVQAMAQSGTVAVLLPGVLFSSGAPASAG